MCKRRRRSFILIEVLVATSLFVMLLVAMFAIFVRTSKVNQSINKLRVVNEQFVLTQSRLQELFSKCGIHSVFRPYFFIENSSRQRFPGIVFTFDNGTPTDYKYANAVLGRLYVDDNRLCLAYWPHLFYKALVPTEMRKEVLLENVSDFQVLFFYAPQSMELKQQQEADENEKEVNIPEGVWLSKWPKEYKQPPTLVKLIVKKSNGEPFVFRFFIPSEIKPIIYPRL